MTIPYYKLRVRKYKTHFWTSYCVLPSCPEYTAPTLLKRSKNSKVIFISQVLQRNLNHAFPDHSPFVKKFHRFSFKNLWTSKWKITRRTIGAKDYMLLQDKIRDHRVKRFCNLLECLHSCIHILAKLQNCMFSYLHTWILAFMHNHILVYLHIRLFEYSNFGLHA